MLKGAVVSKFLTFLGVGASVAGIIYIFSLVPIHQVLIPDNVFNFLTSGNFQRVMNLIYYFFPVDFALNCLSTIFLTHIGVILFRMINHILSYLASLKGSKS